MNAYIVAGFRSAVGKAPKGKLRFTRPDDLAADVIKYLLAAVPSLDPKQIDDLIVGCAVPESEQGMQMGRMISLLSLPMEVPGMILNRYCGSGLESIAMAAYKIDAGMADCIIAGGTENMSMIPVMGWKTVLNYDIASKHPDWYSSMGATAEAVATEYQISRDDQDLFSFESHQKALAAINEGKFVSGIVPINIHETYVDERGIRKTKTYIFDTDEGPRADTTIEALSKLKPVFAANGSVTAGNSSQTSDGASFLMLMSERMVKQLNIEPIARLLSHAVAGVDPRVMGMGPVKAIPMALAKAGLTLNQIDQIELNEAFASQALAVMRTLDLDQRIVNVNGGAIALGHPLGCSGAKLSVQLINEMRLRKQKYGIVSACVGGGQGVAGVFEFLK